MQMRGRKLPVLRQQCVYIYVYITGKKKNFFQRILTEFVKIFALRSCMLLCEIERWVFEVVEHFSRVDSKRKKIQLYEGFKFE